MGKCSGTSWIVIAWFLVAGLATMAVADEAQKNFHPDLKITEISADAPTGFSRVFSRQADVFGVKIFATERTPENKVSHTANVLAQYLDNDADGRVDNDSVIQMLRKNDAAMIMAATERSFERMERDFERHIPERVLDSMSLQGLFGEEVHPAGASRGVFDATFEEVLHLITHAGYAEVYPKVFGERSGSELAKAMDKARGGHYRRVPRSYPAGAWYTYDDRTCDYGCQATEYLYWGLTSLLGAQSFPGRFQEIRHEWRLNTPKKMKAGDPALYRLLTDSKYRFPTVLPDGKYKPR